MRIDNAHLNLRSSHTLTVRQEQRDQLKMRVTPAAASFEPRPSIFSSQQTTSPDTRTSTQTATKNIANETTDAETQHPKLALIIRLVEILTGRPVKVFDPTQLTENSPQDTGTPSASPDPAGFSINLERRTTSKIREEHEQTIFSAEGTVQTTDGQSIHFQLELSMARDFREETHLVSLPEAPVKRKDPLVLNFNGKAAELSNQRFQFDLNGDGTQENLPLLASGSAYLAFDRNNNNRVDSGRELFGPTSDNGFSELEQLDADHNGWIDQNDPAYGKLRLWIPSNGNLTPLGQSGIGALYTGNIASSFALRGANNADLGTIRATSLYLDQSGKPGTIQEIDLTV